MDRDTFIITVYCLVDDEFTKLSAVYRIRHAGFKPELSDVEVMTMEICGEYFKHHTDKDLFSYFAQHYRHFFPRLSERSLFVRQAANLWQFKAALQRRLTCLGGQAADPVQPIDTLPLPVCTYTRAGRDRCFPGEADYGYCDAKDLHYYGFKLGLLLERCGMIIHSSMKPLPLVVVWVSGSTVVSISCLSLEGANHQGETTMSDKRFKLLSHSLWECQDHLVFCPKYRSRVLGGEVGSYVDRHIYRLLAQKAGVSVLECNVQPDHVHLVAEIPPKYSVSDILGAPSREAGTAHLQAVSPVWPPVLGAALLGTGLLREYRRS